MTGIPFNRPFLTGKERQYIDEALVNGRLSGDGPFTARCSSWLERETRCSKALLTHSCTAALEMSALLADIHPGDEVILPSFTFVSTANAFVLRGAVPVFVDIRPDTLNINEAFIESAITPRTRAIVPVHYAGVSCEMDAILEIASRHKLLVVEDAAQAIRSTYRGRALGTLGHLGTLSFHETKNVIAGEGGALLINSDDLLERAEIIREKGTNRSRFFRGQVDKYTWIDIGSSYLPSELIAAFLYAQLEQTDRIIAERLRLWDLYHQAMAEFETRGLIRRPVIPTWCGHNGHIYYLLMRSLEARTRFIDQLREAQIQAAFHYIPLHSAPAGLHYGRTPFPMDVTDRVADCLVRLPLWVGMPDGVSAMIAAALHDL
jgi:dTDP-4-amino-4,6-dideoxygalactose transaminase